VNQEVGEVVQLKLCSRDPAPPPFECTHAVGPLRAYATAVVCRVVTAAAPTAVGRVVHTRLVVFARPPYTVSMRCHPPRFTPPPHRLARCCRRPWHVLNLMCVVLMCVCRRQGRRRHLQGHGGA
jgi:hypothetical protein